MFRPKEGRCVKAHKVLIIEDDATLKTALFRIITREGFQVVTSTKIEETITLLKSQSKWDHIILDLQLPDGCGMDLLSVIKSTQPDAKILILTGNGTISQAVEATQKGVDQFLTKPVEMSQILTYLKKHSNADQNIQMPSLPKQKMTTNIIGDSSSIQSVLSLVEKVSNTESTVLITGESGTGKELIAKSIHNQSQRKNNPFVAINCGAIPMELLESELFGHAKGAFTGAISNRIGRFEMADGGTLFLDEIGDMHPSLQVKLLRVLQEKSFEPVGSTKSIQVNVRVIAATNVNLEKAVTDGKFREDLYYRLNVIPIHIPSLRERVEDIPLLLNHFLKNFNRGSLKQITGFCDQVIQQLSSYPWPGNIRELENLVERITILKDNGLITTEDLPLKYKNTSFCIQSQALNSNIIAEPHIDDLDFNSAVDHYENQLILKALEKTGWNRNQAAILLKLNRTTLVEKIKKKGLKPPENVMETN